VRLIHLADYRGPYAGSLVPMLRAACAVGTREGWEVELLLSDVARGRPWLQAFADDGIPVHFVPAGSRGEAQAAIAAHMAGVSGPAILHSHFASFDIPLVRALRGRPRTGLWWHLHSHLEREPLIRLRNTARFLVYGRGVDEILCVSPHLLREARTRLAPAGRVHLLPNAIDTRQFPLVTPDERASAREELGLPADARVVVHLGWDWLRKGGDLLLDAVERLDDLDDLVVLSVGSGEVGARAIAAQGLEGRVRQLDPFDDTSRLYAATDVLVHPSRDEGMPLSVIEALSRGIGVVASSIPGHRYVGRDLGAIRYSELEPGGIAAGVRELLARDPAIVDRDARNAHERVAASLDLRQWAEALRDRYRRRAPL